MTDRPTGPATLSRENPKSRWHSESEPNHRHGWACIPITEAVYEADRAAAAERTRIFAALPAALQELVDMDIRGATREEFHQKRAAALVVAIEKELARHDHD